MPRLSDPGFWQPYLPSLRREFVDLVMDILMAGGDAGAKAIPLLSVLIDWDVFNQDALDWLDMYLGTAGPTPGAPSGIAWAWALVDATRRGVAREIDRWIRAGAPLPELERRLLPFFDRKRAHRVAVTEVTRVYASGNILAWKASGVVDGKRWQTAVDERVCPICSRLHNTFVDLDRGWEFTAEMLAADPALARAVHAPMGIVAPPAHVNCRCWLLPVVYAALSPEEMAVGRYDPMRGSLGTPVSRATGIDAIVADDIRGRAERAMSAIDGVHGDGNLTRIPVYSMNTTAEGTYRYDEQYGDPMFISLSAQADHAELTMLHEVGHFLDHQAIGRPGKFASAGRVLPDDVAAAVRAWAEAVKNSNGYKRLKSLPAQYEFARGGQVYPLREDFKKYLLSREELWARSYAQFIAEESGDAILAEQLEAMIADAETTGIWQQWEPGDFAPIRDSIRNLFRVKGWMA